MGSDGGPTDPLVARMRPHATTVFAEFSALAVATASINLGQGFPDEDGPLELRRIAADALVAGPNQYPPSPGIPELRTAVSEHQRRHYGLDVDPTDGVLVTVGATEAIAASILGLCEPGDEIVVFEPYYDSYAAVASLAGAVRRCVPLRPPDWTFDPAELRAAVSPRTRLLVLNTPHNPTGKVFDADELQAVAEVCLDHDLVAVSDEVYEHLVYDGTHVPLATRPGMAGHTLTISSVGKSFSATGWKVGWVSGPPELVAAARTVKQFLSFAQPAALQLAAAAGLTDHVPWARALAGDLAVRRDLLCDGLASLGFDVFRPAATYFATTDIAPLGHADADAFCRDLPARCGVVAIPSQVFYDDRRSAATLVRWAFCKRREVLDDALGRLSGAELSSPPPPA